MKNISKRVMKAARKFRRKKELSFALATEQADNTLVIGAARKCHDGAEVITCFPLQGGRRDDIPRFINMYAGTEIQDHWHMNEPLTRAH